MGINGNCTQDSRIQVRFKQKYIFSNQVCFFVNIRSEGVEKHWLIDYIQIFQS